MWIMIKSTKAGKILAGNSKVYETHDANIKKEMSATIEYVTSSFLFGQKKPLAIDSIYLMLFQK